MNVTEVIFQGKNIYKIQNKLINNTVQLYCLISWLEVQICINRFFFVSGREQESGKKGNTWTTSSDGIR